MKKLPWKNIAIGCLVIVALVVVRAAVSAGRAMYWHNNVLSVIQKDPWVYVGFAALAVAIIAWTMLPGDPEVPETAAEAQAEEETE